MVNSTVGARRQKPSKPYPDFPLFPHATGRWAKKIKSKLYYFGPWEDHDAALLKYQDQRDDLYAGRKPRAKSNGLTMHELANHFLRVKNALKDDGELSPKTFITYHRTCAMLLRVLGKTRSVADLDTEDFETIRATALKGLSMTSRKVAMQNIRTVFNFAYDEGYIDRPLRFGLAFKMPNAKNVQKEKTLRKAGWILTAEHIRRLIDAADIYLRAMILLGINCGMGNADIGKLTLSSLDLDHGWLDDFRQKTGVARRCKLWPETVKALRAAIAKRRVAKNVAHADLVFITQRGSPWWSCGDTADGKNHSTDAVNFRAGRLFKKLGINQGASFYSLRRMTETIGGGCRDQVAVDAVMAHVTPGMGTEYRLGVEDDRLKAVANVIHAWLWPADGKEGGNNG